MVADVGRERGGDAVRQATKSESDNSLDYTHPTMGRVTFVSDPLDSYRPIDGVIVTVDRIEAINGQLCVAIDTRNPLDPHERMILGLE